MSWNPQDLFGKQSVFCKIMKNEIDSNKLKIY